MARPFTVTQRALAGSDHNLHSRLLVLGSSGVSYVDLSAYLGVSWLLSASGDETIDNPVATATFKLVRETVLPDNTVASLAPLMLGSPANPDGPALWLNRSVRYETAVTAPGVAPVTGDWVRRFTGFITSIDAAQEDGMVLVSASDPGSILGRAQFMATEDAERTYGSDSGIAVEVVMQQMIDDVLGPGAVTLQVPESPGWLISKFVQDPNDSLLQALRNLALQIGWDVRYRYVGADPEPQLVFFEPARDTALTPVLILPPSEYLTIPRQTLSDQDIRNIVRVGYVDAEGVVRYVTEQDGASRALYGDHFMEVQEASSSNIDTQDEAQAMALAALQDLSQPYADWDVTGLDLWMLQLGDTVQVGANGILFDDDEYAGIQALRWEHAAGHGDMTLTLRGKPGGAFADWLARQGTGPRAGGEPTGIGLTDLSFTEDADGIHRTYTWTRGKNVAYVWAYDRTLEVPVPVDPWPTTQDPPSVNLPTGTDAYTVSKPAPGFQGFLLLIPWYKAGGVYKRGPAVKVILDPPPVALDATIKATVRDAVADLAVTVTGGATDWPVAVAVYENDPDAEPLDQWTAATAGVWTAATRPALGSRPLPLREAARWWVRLVNTAGEVRWGAPTAADRNPLPDIQITRQDYLAQPLIIVGYDDDTDTIVLTVPGGRTKTWGLLTGGGAVTYQPGSTVLDNGTIEQPLGVGETRAGYSITATGGGQTVTFWENGQLHGVAAQPPQVRPRTQANLDRSAEDVYAILETYTPEQLTLWLRDGDGATAPLYRLVAGAADTTPLYLPNGSEVGPGSWFHDGTGAPVQKLSQVTLLRDQIRRYYLRAEGEQSHVQGPWVTVPLSLQEAPYLESIAATWDDTAGEIRVRVVGGPHTASVVIEVDDDPNFASPLTAFSAALTDKAELTHGFPLTGAQRGKVWHARATPYNRTGAVGLPGAAVVDEVMVPALFTYNVDVPANDTVRVTVDDPSGVIDPATKVRFYVTTGNGARTLVVPTSAPAGTTTTGVYTLVIVLDPKHSTLVEPVIYLRDGTQEYPGGQTLDFDTQANIALATVAYAGAVATVTAVADSDTALGASRLRYSTDGGATWTYLTVPAGRVVQWFLAMSTTQKLSVVMQGQNAQSEWGPTKTVEVSRYDAVTSGPTLNVVATPSALTYSISWSASAGGTVVYKVNGVATSLPSSPFTVSRPLAGQLPAHHNFSLALGGQTIDEDILVLPVDADTATPDVQLIPSSVSPTQMVFTAYATNPKSGGFINATFTFADCSGTVAGTFVGAGGSLTVLANGITVVANRPALGSPPGSVKMRATITGGGAAEINRTVSEGTKDFTAPTFEPTLSSTATTVTAQWNTPDPGVQVYAKTDTGSWTLQYTTPFGPFNLNYTVSRNAPGGNTRTLYVKAVIVGTSVETVRSFPVPPQESTGGGGGSAYSFASFSATVNYPSNGFSLTWSGTFPAGSTFRVFRSDSGSIGIDGFSDMGTTSGSTFFSPAETNIAPGGAAGIETHGFYVVAESGAGVVATSVTRTSSANISSF